MKSRIVLYLLFGFGILWHSLPVTFENVLLLTPFILLLVYFLILYPEIKGKNVKSITWLLVIYFITLIVEIYGVSTGKIFGSYFYGETLGIKIFEVPLIIGLNWGMIIWGSCEIADKLKFPTAIRIITAAILAIVVDILIEPLAGHLGYWNWSNNIIPLQNYAAWFIISVLFSAAYISLKVKAKSTLPEHFYITQVIFFGALNFLKV